jgi:hypothetical protein
VSYLIYTCTASPAGGLADRFKGLLSCYGLAKHLNREFMVNWTFPYKLTSVVQPNEIDWTTKPIEGTHKEYFFIDNENFNQLRSILENKQAEKLFTNDIVSIRTNINFLNYFDLSFAETFDKLFKFNYKTVEQYINPQTLGVSCRFGGQQANWEGDPDFNKVVSFEYVYEEILRLKKETKAKNVFICSDSQLFLNYCSENKLHFTTTQDNAEHIDRVSCSFNGFRKSFTDFFILRECDTIISLKGEFAKTAALSKNKPIIEITGTI